MLSRNYTMGRYPRRATRLV